jgi:hypothetical protein
VKQRVLAFGALQLLGVGIIFVTFDPPSLIPFPTLQLHGQKNISAKNTIHMQVDEE